MTDLMCHPQDFGEWTRKLDSSCGAVPELSVEAEGAASQKERRTSPEAWLDSTGKAAGHTGIMKLAASVVRDLASHRLLFRLLCHDGEHTGDSLAGHPSSSQCALHLMLHAANRHQSYGRLSHTGW